MITFTRVLQDMLQLLIQLGTLVLAGIVAIEVWLRTQLTELRVPEPLQTALLIGLMILLIVAALRLFGGLIRAAVIIILLLIVLHILLPVVQLPTVAH